MNDMSVIRITQEQKLDRPQSGSGMDRVVARRGIPLNLRIAVAGVAAILVLAAIWWLMPRTGSQTIAADRVKISTVSRGTFEDFIPLRARVTPLVTVYLDAIEGGRVEKVLVEDGATVAAGQPIAMLSNAELQLSVLARQTEVTQQLNTMRSQELALAQSRVTNERTLLEAETDRRKAERQHDREAALIGRGFVSKRQFADTQDDRDYQRRRVAVLRNGQATDERLQASQLAQLRSAAQSLESSLTLARANLDALNLRAPVAGGLSGFSIQVGQSLSRGERIGQIDSPGRNKLVAGIDEFYLGRVQVNQAAVLERGGKTFRARVTKIYPQVQNGQFTVDLQFIGPEPADLQRGQTLQARLTLGDPAPALLVPNGAFYGETGGNWIFVATPEGTSAVKRPVRMGRRNSEVIEVLEGLEAGERVITSPYTGFADKDRLDLTR
ncbi:hypothetical protein NX02_01415 [Sphingomonas sanxanigenens DSM 19645 = NX02]|uniref:CzcB-like C-terminal circularly permuted SH3-like domain-containing protein n=2 Tax=Sphingomonas sanxanigenens TaxID=397260 RepID=W0A2A2_9SPHN|nr:hypothetical protein NX02_01415 [Sphingomonas sanxanigenens DSM 19645 = NX02]